MDKPPYRVPDMTEIAAIPPNGYTVVSTFSGCGGSCLGFKMAGFQVLWASEFIPAAQETYRANHPKTHLDTRDIRQVTAADILQIIGNKEIDVLEGSPPCASFSMAGKREKGWNQVKPYSDTKQRVDDLFFEFTRLLKELQPKVFVAENVSGLVRGVAKGYFKEILAALKGCGYTVEARLLDAQWLGVPQSRQRIIFMGIRQDLPAKPAFPIPLPYQYSVRDTCPWIKKVQKGGGFGSVSLIPSTNVVSDTIGTGPQQGNGLARFIEPEADISRFAIGREAKSIPEGGKSNRYINLSRAHRDKPCPTITAPSGLVSAATVIHPVQLRRFTIAELKRICAFPDDFILTGTYAQQWERLGRAVPPLMMKAIAEVIRDRILPECQ